VKGTASLKRTATEQAIYTIYPCPDYDTCLHPHKKAILCPVWGCSLYPYRWPGEIRGEIGGEK